MRYSTGWALFWAVLIYFMIFGSFLVAHGAVVVLWPQAPAEWQYIDVLEVAQCLEVSWDWAEVPGPYGTVTNANGSVDNRVDVSYIVNRTLPKKAFFRVRRK